MTPIRTEKRHWKTVQIVREATCAGCGKLYGQTAGDVRKNTLSNSLRNPPRCPACKKALKAAGNPLAVVKRRPRNALEVVLPKTLKSHFDKKKTEWFMRVRVRKSGSDEKFKQDKVYLGVGADASPEAVQAAFRAAYARMELKGASKRTKEQKRAKAKKLHRIVADRARSWKQGRDRDLGISKQRIVITRFKVVLPDPLVDGVFHTVGRFKTRGEARKARDARYKELVAQRVPCALCGVLPEFGRMRITHFSSACPNRVQLPYGLRPLFSVRLWNLVFAEGTVPNAGKLEGADLGRMGYMYSPKGVRWYAREDVAMNLSLAEKYRIEPPPIAEPEPIFE